VAQQDIQAAHRIREVLVGQRTAKANQMRGLVGEYGLVAPTGIQLLRRALPKWLEEAENGLSDDLRVLLADLAADLRYLDDRIVALDERIALGVKNDPVAQRLLKLRGVGPLTASALAGALGEAKERDDALSQWPQALSAREHVNVVTVALANKTARLAWALVHDETHFQPMRAARRHAI